MTEEVKPKGTPYGLAMALLHEFADTLPSAVVLLPDHVLWPRDRCELYTTRSVQGLHRGNAGLQSHLRQGVLCQQHRLCPGLRLPSPSGLTQHQAALLCLAVPCLQPRPHSPDLPAA